MALLNRFSKLNEPGETGIFTFIVTKSVTRDFHRDATTKDFCYGYHRWAISFQRPTDKLLGVHLLLRNPSPSTACIVDFSLTLLNRQHFSQNEVYTKRQAKFTITNAMQGVSRWIQMSELAERRFSDESGEFLFELSLSNMTTIFECDIQLNGRLLAHYKSMLVHGSPASASQRAQNGKNAPPLGASGKQRASQASSSELMSLETNYFTFGAFDWSLTILPLVIPSQPPNHQQAPSDPQQQDGGGEGVSLTANRAHSNSSLSIGSGGHSQHLEPVCRVYLNRLNGNDCLCRVRYRVILGHHQSQQQQQCEHVDSRQLDQLSDLDGRIRGYQFRNTNLLKLIGLRSATANSSGGSAGHHHSQQQQQQQQQHQHQHQQRGTSASASGGPSGSLDLRVHIEIFCANTISEALVSLVREPNEPQASNCRDRNKQAWCVEAERSPSDSDWLRLKLFFLDFQSVPRNHIRYISWQAHVVKTADARRPNAQRESLPARNGPHSNYYLQDGQDLGTLMEASVSLKELDESPRAYLNESGQLTVHLEWHDSLLLFSHLYNNSDSLATIQRHQIRRELSAQQHELAFLDLKCSQQHQLLSQLLGSEQAADQQLEHHFGPLRLTGGMGGAGLHRPRARQAPGDSPDDSSASSSPIQQQQQQLAHHQPHSQQQHHVQHQLSQQHPPAQTVRQVTSVKAASLSGARSAGVAASGDLRRHSLQRYMSVARAESPRQSTSVMIVASGAAPSAAPIKPAPMSHDERLALSSSTPPQLVSGGPGTPTARRRLPRQPAELDIGKAVAANYRGPPTLDDSPPEAGSRSDSLRSASEASFSMPVFALEATYHQYANPNPNPNANPTPNSSSSHQHQHIVQQQQQQRHHQHPDESIFLEVCSTNAILDEFNESLAAERTANQAAYRDLELFEAAGALDVPGPHAGQAPRRSFAGPFCATSDFALATSAQQSLTPSKHTIATAPATSYNPQLISPDQQQPQVPSPSEADYYPASQTIVIADDSFAALSLTGSATSELASYRHLEHMGQGGRQQAPSDCYDYNQLG